MLVSISRWNKQFAGIRAEEQTAHPQAYSREELAGYVKEYRSKSSLFGLPLVHFRTGQRAGERHLPAVGWIALGDRAYGILFAGGGIALGGIAVGGASAGIISIGGACLGGLAFGGLAVGGIAVGGVALGVLAVGGLAAGAVAAQGGLAVARQFALGGEAIALHANDAAARAFFANWNWLDLTRPEFRKAAKLVSWLPLLFIFVGFKKMRDAQKSRGSNLHLQ